MISIVIFADVRLYREGLAEVVGRQPDIDVVGTAPNGRRAIACARQHRPSMALVDMAIPGRGASTVRKLVGVVPGVKVVALAVHETEPQVRAWAEAGIAGYVSREGSLGDLLALVRSVARDEALSAPSIAALLLRRVAGIAVERASQPPLERLTRRELEVVELIAHGLSNKEIARQLCIELATVKNHVHNLLEKLQLRGRVQAASWLLAQQHHRDGQGR